MSDSSPSGDPTGADFGEETEVDAQRFRNSSFSDHLKHLRECTSNANLSQEQIRIRFFSLTHHLVSQRIDTNRRLSG